MLEKTEEVIIKGNELVEKEKITLQQLVEKEKITLQELEKIEEMEGVTIEFNGMSGRYYGYYWYSVKTESGEYDVYMK